MLPECCLCHTEPPICTAPQGCRDRLLGRVTCPAMPSRRPRATNGGKPVRASCMLVQVRAGPKKRDEHQQHPQQTVAAAQPCADMASRQDSACRALLAETVTSGGSRG